MTKLCKKCGQTKDLAGFHSTMFSVDGRVPFCRTCCRGEMLRQEAWDKQRQLAARRGIQFNLTYEEWFTWWHEALAQRGSGAERGKVHGQWMMCRLHDQGPYEVGNIYCGTQADNSADRQLKAEAKRADITIGELLRRIIDQRRKPA